MLITNYLTIYKVLGHQHSGPTSPLVYRKPEVMRNFYSADTYNQTTQSQRNRDSFPTGTNPPYSYVLGPKGGLLSSTTLLSGSGSSTANAAMGINILSDIDGGGTLTSNLALVVALAASLLGQASVSAAMTGKIEMAASLAGSGDITGSLKLISTIVADLTGGGSLVSNLRGTANMEADITPFTTLSPENLAASVWNALASQFNDVGTMGNKLNSAASGGVDYGALADAVWDEPVSGHTTTGTTGAELKKKLNTGTFIANS